MRHEREPSPEPYWQEDLVLGNIELGGSLADLHLVVHRGWEAYTRHQELIPLDHAAGRRLYVHGRPYVVEPDLTLTIAVDPVPRENGHRERIGHVETAMWGRGRRQVVGNAQGWCYPRDATIVLWECILEGAYRQPVPAQDPLLALLWQGFEQLLVAQLPAATRLVTPSWEPECEPHHWHDFLSAQGYVPAPDHPRAFSKEVSRG